MPDVYFVFAFFISAALTCILSGFIRWYALKRGIVDRSELAPQRKIHKQATPLLGGVAVFISFYLVVLGYVLFSQKLLGGYLLPKHIMSLFLASCIIMIGGYFDDRFNVPARFQIIWTLLAILVIIAGGIGVSYITNPFGGVWHLDRWQFTFFSWRGVPYKITLLADIFAIFWLLATSYTTKLLDGLDGLVSGITTIAGIILFFLSISRMIGQPETALLSIILAGSFLGFLFWNWHPAKLFLGEGGSMYAGFMLGALAIVSGAKIATTLLLLGLPALDVLWVIMRRIFLEKKNPFTHADRLHLHFRLLDVGLKTPQAVLFLYVLTIIFGVVSLFIAGRGKVYALLLVILTMIVLGTFLVKKYKQQQKKQH